MSQPQDTELSQSAVPSWKRKYRVAYFRILLLLISYCTLIMFLNSRALVEVRIKLQPGQKEHLDKSLTLDRHEWLPDYEVRIRSNQANLLFPWYTAGTQRNVSAKEWLSFPLADPLPMQSIAEIQVRDHDAFVSDILDSVSILDSHMSSDTFLYELKIQRRLRTGMNWLFEEDPVGKVILVAVLFAVLLIMHGFFGLF